jgi:hypothetical protein
MQNPETHLWQQFIFRMAHDMVGHAIPSTGTRGPKKSKIMEDAIKWRESRDFALHIEYADFTERKFEEYLLTVKRAKEAGKRLTPHFARSQHLITSDDMHETQGMPIAF